MEDEERVDAGSIVAVVAAIAVASAFSLWRSLRNMYGVVDLTLGPLSGTLGYVLGQATVSSLVVFVVVYLVYLRHRDSQRTPTYFLVTLASVFVINLAVFAVVTLGVVGRYAQSNDEALAVFEINRALAIAPNPAAGPIDMRIKAHGEPGELERLAKDMAQAQRTASVHYRDALAALDYPAIVSPSRLARRNFAATRTKLAAARAALQAYRIESAAPIAKLRGAVAAAGLSGETRGRFLKSFNGRVALETPLRDRMLVCADGVFGEFDAIAALLAHPRSPWRFSGRTFLFSNQHDLDAYNGHIRTVQGYQEEEHELTIQAQTGMNVQELGIPR